MRPWCEMQLALDQSESLGESCNAGMSPWSRVQRYDHVIRDHDTMNTQCEAPAYYLHGGGFISLRSYFHLFS